MTDIAAVDKAQMIAVTDSGEFCQITNLFDEFGEETNDIYQAVAAVARLDDENWFTIDLVALETVSVH